MALAGARDKPFLIPSLFTRIPLICVGVDRRGGFRLNRIPPSTFSLDPLFGYPSNLYFYYFL
jgi:hypothetical protein